MMEDRHRRLILEEKILLLCGESRTLAADFGPPPIEAEDVNKARRPAFVRHISWRHR